MEEEVAGGVEVRKKESENGGAQDGLVRVSLCMVLVQVFQTGMAVLSKLALNQGMLVFPFLVYRNAIGALSVSCFAFFLERNMLGKLSWRGAVWMFMNAFFGLTLAMGLYYYGLRDTTAAYSIFFHNLIPVVTFIFSVILGIERLGLGSIPGVAKVLGTLVCVGGAMVISLYKGRVLHIWPFHMDISHNSGMKASIHNLTRGTLFLLGSCISYACWFIVQVKMFKAFPSIYWSTTLTCVAGCFQSAVVGLLINRERSAWLVRTELQLATTVYSAVLNTAATFMLVTWAVSKKGPTFPPMFTPLSLVFVTLIESCIMGLQLTVGSILGVCLIIAGFYAFLWGKWREVSETNGSQPRSSGTGDVGMASGLPQSQPSVIPDPVLSSSVQRSEKLPV